MATTLEDKMRAILSRIEEKIDALDEAMEDDDSGLGDSHLGERTGLQYVARQIRAALGMKLRKGNGG